MRPAPTLVWIAVLVAAALLPAVAIVLVPLVVLPAISVVLAGVGLHATPERNGRAFLLASISPAHLPRASLVA